MSPQQSASDWQQSSVQQVSGPSEGNPLSPQTAVIGQMLGGVLLAVRGRRARATENDKSSGLGSRVSARVELGGHDDAQQGTQKATARASGRRPSSVDQMSHRPFTPPPLDRGSGRL